MVDKLWLLRGLMLNSDEHVMLNSGLLMEGFHRYQVMPLS